MNTSKDTVKIDEDKRFKYFLNSRDIRETTKKVYKREIVLYTESTGLTPTEIIKEAREDQVNEPWMEDRRLPIHLQNHIRFMEKRNYAKMRIKNAIGVIRSFYGEFGIALPKTRYKAKPETFYTEVEDLPGYMEIRKAITIANIKYRAIISLMATSAMSIIDLQDLSVQDFLQAIGIERREMLRNGAVHIPQISEIEEDRIATWKRIRVKTGVPHVTFSTPESVHFILDYLQRHPPHTLETPLFRPQGKKEDALKTNAFQRYFMKLNDAAGWEKTSHGYYFTTRTLRKYFGNTLERLGLPHRYIRIMMGHKMEDITQSYFKLDIPAFLEEYKRAIPSLTFLEKVQLVETEQDLTKHPEYIKLQDEVKSLSKIVQQTIEDRKKRFEELPQPRGLEK